MRIVRGSSLCVLLLLSMAQVRAAEDPSGCDKFKWNIDHERTALTASDRAKLNSGADLNALPSNGVILTLVAPAEARLPSSPQRAPRDGTFAGFANVKATPKAGLYTISLSGNAWVDVVQEGRFLKPKGVSGATDCDGIRKALKYQLSEKPFVLQISGVKENSISVAILPSE